MPKYLPLPDGSYLQLKEGESGAEGLERARSTYPEAFASTKSAAQPEGGFIAATKAGATELGGGISALMGKLGLKDEAKAQAEYEAAQKRAKEIFKPTEAGWTEDPWTKFKETLGGSVPYMAAPLAAGAAAAALPLTGTAAAIAGLGAAGVTSAGQFTATNLARQMDEGKKLAETDLGAAALAAIPQAALDTLSMRMIPGIGKMFGAVGEKVTAQTAKQMAEQGLKKVAAEYALQTGKAMGTEGLTEAAQQVFERLQAGLSITDEKARQEYFDSFIGGAVLGGALAPAGQYVERSGRQTESEKLLAEEQKAQRAKDAAAEEEKRQQPDYLEGLNSTYQTLQQQKRALQAQLKKGTKDTPLTQDDKDNNELINRQLKELSKPLEQARRDFLDAGGMPALQKMRAAQPPRIELTSEGQETLGGPEPEPEPTAEEAAARDVPRMQAFLEAQRAQMAQAGSPEEALQIAQQMQKLSQQIEAAQKLVPETPAAPAMPDATTLAKREKRLLKALALAQEQGDFDKVVTYGQQLRELREQQKSAAQATQASKDAEGLFAPEQIAAEDLRRTAYEERTERERRAQERETQAYEQRGLDLEQEFNREQDARDAEMAGYERAVAERNAAFRGAEQTTLFPEKRERVVQRIEGPSVTGAQVRLQEQIAALERRLAQARDPQKVASIEQKIDALDAELQSLQPEALVQERTLVPPSDAQFDTRPKATDAAQVATLLTRLQDSNNIDDATKDLAAATEQLPQVTQTRLRPLIRDWAYRALSGTPVPELEQELRGHLRTAQQGAISETEQRTQYAQRALTEDEKASLAGTSMEDREGVMTRAPSGEIARQMQYTLPMPEPTAEARESWAAFNEYLASEGLDILRKAEGLAAPTVARLQQTLAPIQARINALQAQLKDIAEKRAALQSADLEQRTHAAAAVRTAEEKLQNVLADLEQYASVTFVGYGKKERSVNIKDLFVSAQKRVSDALNTSETLRQQIAENLQNLAAAKKDAEKISPHSPTTRAERAAWEALKLVKENLRIHGKAFIEADTALAKALVREGKGAPTEATYRALKRVRDMALRKVQHAEYLLQRAWKRIPSSTQLESNLSKLLTEKAALDAQIAQAARVLRAAQMGAGNAAKRLDAARAAVKENPLFGFAPALESLRVQLHAAEKGVTESQRQSEETQGTLGALAETAKGVRTKLKDLQSQVSDQMRTATARAEARRTAKPTTTETLSEREARDAAQRREEQGFLERMEASGQLISFERDVLGKTDETYLEIIERMYNPSLSAEERIAAAEEADAYLEKREAAANAAAAQSASNVKLHEANLAAAEKTLATMQEKAAQIALSVRDKKKYKTPEEQQQRLQERKDTAAKKIANQEAKIAGHRRKLSAARDYPKVLRTSRKELAEYRQELNDAVSRTRETGERLGTAEGTQRRAIGPVTRPERFAPTEMRTSSEESKAGETTTPSKNKLAEARGVKERDVAMTEAEQAEANKLAEDLRKKKEADAAKRALEATKEAAKLGAPKKPAKTASRLQETFADLADIDEDAFTPEILGGPENEVFFSRGETANPSDAASVKAELREVFPDLGRVQVYDTVDDLIAANPQYEGKIPADARGFVDTAGNKAFLIGENIEQGQALGVLLHEVGAHIGLKNMLGDAQYNALVKAVESWEKRNDGSVEARVARAARARVESAETADSHVDDELLAYAIEEAVNAGVKPMQTKGPIGQWLSRIVQAFRKVLERFGLQPKALDAQKLVDMAFGAAEMQMAPKTPQISRRNFLRGAGAALGAMKLPPLSKEMNLRALRGVFEASLDARATWFDALKAAAKTKGLGRVVNQYEDLYEGDSALVNFTQSDALQDFLQRVTYDENYQGDGYDYYLNELLSGKDGVKIVADLQQALRAQGASLVEAAQKMAKEKGLPEVGDLFFSEASSLNPSDRPRYDLKPEQMYSLGKVGPIANAYVYVSFFKPLRREAEGWVQATLYDGDLFKEGLSPSKTEVECIQLSVSADGKHARLDTFGVPGSSSGAYSKYREQITAVNGYNKFKPGVFSTAELRRLFRSIRHTAVEEGLFDAVSDLGITRGTGATAGSPTRYLSREEALRFSRKPKWNPGMQAAGAVVDKAVASEQSWASKLKAALYGFRTMAVDKLAPVEEALQQKVAKGTLEDYKATQAMYYLRMYDQRNHFTSKAVSDGVPQLVQITRDDGRKEHVIEAKPGANLKGIVDILADKAVVKAAGSADAAHRLFSMYLIAKRAERVGLAKLDFGGSITEADLKTVKQAVESDPALKKAFKEARDQYNQYNRNLLEFSVQTGAMSRELADNLLSSDDYTPYYRVKDGVVNMLVGGQHPIKIGNLKDSPHLQELIGGDKPVIDFLTASVQNTSMLLDMAMKNIAQKNLVWEMHDLGLAKMRTAKHGAAPQNAIKFYDKGVESYAVLDEAALAAMGLDAGLMLKGLQGIPTMLPTALRLMALPARILRRAVVASPVYAARQIFRDSLGAAMTSGANLTPVISSLRQFGKSTHTLDKRGVTGGQVFSGMPDDISRLLKQMQAGKGGWTMALTKLEAVSMEADASTRRAQYESYRKQGLSEMEATYMALESMNFSKRGLSPSLHAIAQIIPFFNAQIQSLDVLQRAMRGKMPMQEQLDIKRKLYTRGLLLTAGTLAYAMAMQDDDAYKNATPEQKYGNWFVRVAGLDEPVRVPIPFELGYIFKALPEALVNTMLNEKGGEAALKALTHIVQQTIPGGSSYGIPQAVKPLIEVGLGKSFFTGRDIESAKEQMEEPFMRYRDKTTDAAKWVGEVFNISPVKLEYLINGYTGGMGIAMMAALNPVFPDVTAPGALKRLSEYPVVGGAVQPNDASGIIDGAYERVLEIQRVQQTYKTLLQQNPQRAQAYLEEKGSEMALASAAGQFRQTMGELTKQERSIRSAPSMTPEAKRESLDRIRQVKIRLAASVRPALDRTIPQAARP